MWFNSGMSTQHQLAQILAGLTRTAAVGILGVVVRTEKRGEVLKWALGLAKEEAKKQARWVSMVK